MLNRTQTALRTVSRKALSHLSSKLYPNLSNGSLVSIDKLREIEDILDEYLLPDEELRLGRFLANLEQSRVSSQDRIGFLNILDYHFDFFKSVGIFYLDEDSESKFTPPQRRVYPNQQTTASTLRSSTGGFQRKTSSSSWRTSSWTCSTPT